MVNLAEGWKAGKPAWLGRATLDALPGQSFRATRALPGRNIPEGGGGLQLRILFTSSSREPDLVRIY
jgi:hypothetical protein